MVEKTGQIRYTGKEMVPADLKNGKTVLAGKGSLNVRKIRKTILDPAGVGTNESLLSRKKMQKKTEIYMRQNHMTAPGDGVLVGLSGGADSVGLLLVLVRLQKIFEISVRAIHVHHGLRGAEADRDALFSRALCGRLGVPFYESRIDAAKEAREGKCSVEEAGRQARYRLYEKTALVWEKEMRSDLTSENADGKGAATVQVHIATAHHADDNAETVLLNLFRGSGLTGLSGIAPVRGRIIRPLLWAQRSEIQAWLRQQGELWVEDSTNQESAYSRNWIRNELLPSVQSRLNAQAVRHIDQAGRRIRQADEYFECQAEEWLHHHVSGSMLDGEALETEAEILQGYILRRFFSECGMPLRDVTERHIEAVRELLHRGTGKRVSLPHGFQASCTYGKMTVIREEKDVRKPAEAASRREEAVLEELSGLSVQKGEKNVRWNGDLCAENFFQMRVFPCENKDEFPKKQYTKWFDYDKIKDTLSLRHRRPGDYLVLPSGGRKTLKSWMIDEKIPRQEREAVWLLAEGNHILWIVGHRISAYYKITEQTKNILEVKFNGGKNSG